MNYTSGDRVRVETIGDDGLPLVRYGFVSGQNVNGGPLAVLLDGELRPSVFAQEVVQPVSIANVVLSLNGADLFDDPALRTGLLALWQGEVDTAGLAVEQLSPIQCNCPHEREWPLAEFTSCGERYVVHAERCPGELVRVRATRQPG